MAELIWDGKYDEHGNKRAPVRIELPFQTVETVNESVQDRQRTLELSASGHDPEWRNRLIWGDKKYVLPSLLPEFAGKVDLIYIDPPFDTGADFRSRPLFPDILAQRTTRAPHLRRNRLFSSRRPIGIRGATDLILICNGSKKPLSSCMTYSRKRAASTCTWIGI
jgi:hypothetical protein